MWCLGAFKVIGIKVTILRQGKKKWQLNFRKYLINVIKTPSYLEVAKKKCLTLKRFASCLEFNLSIKYLLKIEKKSAHVMLRMFCSFTFVTFLPFSHFSLSCEFFLAIWIHYESDEIIVSKFQHISSIFPSVNCDQPTQCVDDYSS